MGNLGELWTNNLNHKPFTFVYVMSSNLGIKNYENCMSWAFAAQTSPGPSFGLNMFFDGPNVWKSHSELFSGVQKNKIFLGTS